MKKSTILKQAKQYLGKGPRAGVCYALDAWLLMHEKPPHEKYEKLDEIVQDIQKYIWRAIHPFGYAHTWLAYKVLRISPKNHNYEAYLRTQEWIAQNQDHLPAWRLRWMDKMIAEYGAKGE